MGSNIRYTGCTEGQISPEANILAPSLQQVHLLQALAKTFSQLLLSSDLPYQLLG